MSMAAQKRNGTFFPVFFGLIGVVFLGILLFVYRKVEQNRPVMLDEKGQIISTAKQ
jgi:hypothetical protein